MTTRPPFRKPLGLLLAGIALWSGGGCTPDPLFDPKAPRTQFETYDRMHGRYTPVEQPDVFGNAQPALRARLSRQ